MRRRHRGVHWGIAITIFTAVGCSTDQVVMQSGLPGAQAGAALELLAERGDYLDVSMEAGGFHYRFFLPDDDSCRALFANEQAVTYAHAGPFGRLQAGDTACDPIGVLSLPEWRNRRPRPKTTGMVPRDRAELRERVYVDEELALIRGRYRLAVQMGIVGGADMLAVIPNSAECQGLAVPSSASMEYRPAGKRVFSLVNGNALCPIIGFVLPPPGPGSQVHPQPRDTVAALAPRI